MTCVAVQIRTVSRETRRAQCWTCAPLLAMHLCRSGGETVRCVWFTAGLLHHNLLQFLLHGAGGSGEHACGMMHRCWFLPQWQRARPLICDTAAESLAA